MNKCDSTVNSIFLRVLDVHTKIPLFQHEKMWMDYFFMDGYTDQDLFYYLVTRFWLDRYATNPVESAIVLVSKILKDIQLTDQANKAIGKNVHLNPIDFMSVKAETGKDDKLMEGLYEVMEEAWQVDGLKRWLNQPPKGVTDE